MPLTHRKRIALELFGPAIIGASPFIVAAAGLSLWKTITSNQSWEFPFKVLQAAGAFLLYAYLVVGIQSILFTAIMEWRFTFGLNPQSWQSVTLSALLGFASGSIIALAFGSSASERNSQLLVWGGIGLAVGFTCGLLIKILSKPKKNPVAT